MAFTGGTPKDIPNTCRMEYFTPQTSEHQLYLGSKFRDGKGNQINYGKPPIYG